MLGDGCIYVSGKPRSIYQISVCGSLKDEQEYLLNYVAPLMKSVIGIEPRVKLFKGCAIYLCINSREAVEALAEIGLKPGNKIRNNLGIPVWVKENPDYLRVCLRGLIDTDGSVYKLSNRDAKYGYMRISFKNRNQQLLADVKEALAKLGINASKVIYYNIFITAQSHVRTYQTLVGFKNPKHLHRLAPSSSGQTSSWVSDTRL